MKYLRSLLVDEINRATPKTQSALLEAMQEKQVTVAGETRKMQAPFLVLATQNPLEMEGTYPLPEAQLDRFFFKLKIGYPSEEDLHTIIERTTDLDYFSFRTGAGPVHLDIEPFYRSPDLDVLAVVSGDVFDVNPFHNAPIIRKSRHLINFGASTVGWVLFRCFLYG